MSDLIERQDVFNLLHSVSQYMGNWLIQYIEDGISSIPSALLEITVDHALTEEEIKNIKQKMADLPIVLMPPAQPEPHYDEWCDDCKEYDKERHCCPRWNKVIRETLKDAQQEQRWIPCSEMLPEDEYVLISKIPTKISGNKWSVTIAIRTADPRSRKIQWRDIGFDVIQDDKVLAWMPLPKPYKERREDE